MDRGSNEKDEIKKHVRVWAILMTTSDRRSDFEDCWPEEFISSINLVVSSMIRWFVYIWWSPVKEDGFNHLIKEDKSNYLTEEDKSNYLIKEDKSDHLVKEDKFNYLVKEDEFNHLTKDKSNHLAKKDKFNHLID